MSGRKNHHARTSHSRRHEEVLFDDPELTDEADDFDAEADASAVLLDDELETLDDIDDFDDLEDEPLSHRRRQGYRDFDDWN